MSAAWLSIAGNVVLLAFKYWVGILSHSVAIKADAWHTLSDCLSSLIVLAMLCISIKPPDEEHPFGHGRYELVSTMLIGVMLALVAGFFGYEGLMQLYEHREAKFGVAAILVTAVSLVGKELMARYSFRMARHAGNAALAADGWHHRSDALSSLILLIGMLVGSRAWWIDGALGTAIAVYIAYVAFTTIRGAASTIAGEHPPARLIDTVREELANLYPRLDLRPHDFRWHNYIRRQELVFHIVLPSGMLVGEAFSITSRLEEHLGRLLGVEVTIHIEPRKEGRGSPHKEGHA